MPPRRLQRRQRLASKLAELSDELRHDLEFGWSIFERFNTREDMAEVWAELGGKILAEWIARHPGTRPFAWWLFDHQQERPVVASWATPEFVERHRAESRFGFLDTAIWAGLESLQQDQTEYLIGAGLIPADELARLPFALDESDMSGWQRVLYRTMHGPRRPRV